jgi:hypothetical protein
MRSLFGTLDDNTLRKSLARHLLIESLSRARLKSTSIQKHSSLQVADNLIFCGFRPRNKIGYQNATLKKNLCFMQQVIIMCKFFAYPKASTDFNR